MRWENFSQQGHATGAESRFLVHLHAVEDKQVQMFQTLDLIWKKYSVSL